MAVSTFRQGLIELLIAEEGDQCRYCRVKVSKNFIGHDRSNNDATIDHIIPRAKGGTNARPNLALACARCNNAKGDRDLVDFLADPRSHAERRGHPARKKLRNIKFVAAPPREKFIKGTMAWAIQQGDVLPHMAYRRVRPNDLPQSGVRIAQKMTALETARWLREQAEKKGQKWPLA